MTSRDYLLSQAEHCRRTADESTDSFVVQELNRLAREFEERAYPAVVGSPRGVETA